MNGVASQTILPKIFSVSRISRFDVYGNPGEELQKVFKFWCTDVQSIFWVQSLTLALICRSNYFYEIGFIKASLKRSQG